MRNEAVLGVVVLTTCDRLKPRKALAETHTRSFHNSEVVITMCDHLKAIKTVAGNI